MRIFVIVLLEYVRHTGAGRFVRSSAVGYDRAVARNVGEMFLDLVRRHSNRAGQFRIGFAPSFWISRVDKKHVLALVEPLSQLINRDSLGHIRTSKALRRS